MGCIKWLMVPMVLMFVVILVTWLWLSLLPGPHVPGHDCQGCQMEREAAEREKQRLGGK
jgi:hypothetical protein